jgi:methyl-accepting chemotaxis protein
VKNFRLSVQVGILVAVLLLTTLAVAVVGVIQLSRLDSKFDAMVNETGRALRLASAANVEMLASVRAEKNAILADQKAPAIEFADIARQHRDRFKQLSAELSAHVGGASGTEGKTVADLDRIVEEFEKNQKEVLRLAVLKSNTEARSILYTDLYQRAHDAEELIASLAETDEAPAAAQTGGTSRQQPKLAAGQQVLGRLYEVLLHVGAHIAAQDEQGKNKIDAEIRTRLATYHESLRKLSALLNDSERSRALSVLSSLEGVKAQAARVQEQSRVNSDIYARELTMTKTVDVANRCAAIFDNLRKLLSDKLDDERKNVSFQASLGRNVVIGTGVFGSLIALALAILIIRSITQPVGQGVKVFEAMAAGDLTRRLKLDRRDEIGRLGAASDEMAGSLCRVVTQIRAVAGRLGDSAGELTAVSTDLLSQSHEMTTQAESVAAGTEQMSTNVSTMAAAAEQMSTNVSGISSASEEVSVNVGSIVESAGATSRSVGSVAESIGHITTSLQDVARDAKHGSQMTQQARDMAAAATAAMRQLDQAASEITKVTEVIKSIALQTNLLALNATIEATSAGEAGKGFAVVASEVKELASQSAHSAEEIARKIESVQTSTRDAVKVIENVAQFVDQVNVTAGRISEAVDGQTETAGQIVTAVAAARQGVESIARSIAEVGKGATDVSRNTAEAATAATDVSRNASEAAKAAEVISSNIHGVSEATRHNSASAVKLNESAKQLKDLAVQLQQSVSQFRVDQESAAASHE